jgi:Fe-Mn family superoxide dismutase
MPEDKKVDKLRRKFLVSTFSLPIFSLILSKKDANHKRSFGDDFPYKARHFKNFEKIRVFSDNLIRNHLKIYQDSVASLNTLIKEINSFANSGKFSLQYYELKRRFSYDFNSVKLHEIYFESVTKDNVYLKEDWEIFKRIKRDFGSFENWKSNFTDLGMIRGVGWVALCYDKLSDKLFNIWIDENFSGILTGCKILLVMDVFEHSYQIDYGIRKKDYISTFIKVIDWRIVEKRLSE